VRFFSVIALSALIALAAVGRAEAATYGPFTIMVPVTVDSPVPNTIDASKSGFSITVTCKSGALSGSSNVAVNGPALKPGTSLHITYSGPPVKVQMPAGLKSGATVTCSITAEGAPAQSFLIGLNVDNSKTSTQIVLP
jgi:hypothetical protein